ncbi:hypothetical protein [Bacillus sp. BPN334]|uniref:hypothetical protein n=1 Tax=Bacillus sp. BPN334 TaxID=2217815 RepID=UPI0011EBAE4F|nr:hypothetical protein [Bacillus sp. BPN334]KAA0791765.1 hypothetical protein DN393_08040 [Bacillus sp. BPN334]
MEKIIDVFKERPGKSIASLIVLIVSIVAIFKYQDIKVETVQDYWNIINSHQDNSEITWTWWMNILSIALNIVMVGVWFKDIFADDFSEPIMGRIMAFVIGFIHGVFVLTFIEYVFSSLLGVLVSLLIFVAIVWVFFGNNTSSRSRRY